MTTTSLQAPFRVGAVLSRSWNLFVGNLIPFLILAAFTYSPTLVYPRLYGFAQGDASAMGLDELVSLFVFGFLYLLTTAVIVHAVFQSLRGKPVALAASLTAAWRRVVPLVLMLIVWMLAVGLGLMLFVAPGLVLIAVWFVAAPCCVIERLGPMASLGRSRDLTGGCLGAVFGIYILFYIASLLISVAVEALPFLVPVEALYIAVKFLWSALSAAFYSVLVAVAYHDLRVAKEGIDIEQIAAMFE